MQGYSIGTQLQDIFVMGYAPKILNKRIQNRMKSTVLYILKGSYRYKWASREFVACDGDMVYLPRGSSYFYEILTEETEVIQVEFNLCEITQNGCEYIKFCDTPFKIISQPYTLASVFKKMKNSYYNDQFLTASLLYSILAVIKSETTLSFAKGDFAKIMPAINFIETNFCGKVYVEELAKMCLLSQSHLRRLFLKCTGVSPIKYKNTILIKTACNMLLNQGMNVTETSEALGFDDIYTFSQLFKKEMGISPRKFVKNKKS